MALAVPIHRWAAGINSNFTDWTFLGFVPDSVKSSYSPLTVSDSFVVSSDQILYQVALPAELVTKDIDELVPGGKPLSEAAAKVAWLLIVSSMPKSLHFLIREGYDKQFLAYGAHVVGLQETHAICRGVNGFKTFIVAFCPAVKASSGASCVFNKNVSWGAKGNKYICICIRI